MAIKKGIRKVVTPVVEEAIEEKEMIINLEEDDDMIVDFNEEPIIMTEEVESDEYESDPEGEEYESDDDEEEDYESDPEEEDSEESEPEESPKTQKKVEKPKKKESEPEIEEKFKVVDVSTTKKVEKPKKEKSEIKNINKERLFDNICQDIKEVIGKRKNVRPTFNRFKDYFKVKFGELKTNKASLKEENQNSLVDALERNGMSYIFTGCTTNIDKRMVAEAIINSLDEAILDCLINKDTGFGLLGNNAKIYLQVNKAKLYPIIKGSSAKYDVLKMMHISIHMSAVSAYPYVGFTKKNTKGTDELSIPGKILDGNKFEVKDENSFYEVGEIINDNGFPIKK